MTEMRKITCHEADGLRYGLTCISACTDLDAEFHSEPTIETTWGYGDMAVLREYRYPARYNPDPLVDCKPCEHYDVREVPGNNYLCGTCGHSWDLHEEFALGDHDASCWWSDEHYGCGCPGFSETKDEA